MTPQPLEAVSGPLRKDVSLHVLAQSGLNVAQFVSFSPDQNGPRQEYSRILGYAPNSSFSGHPQALEALFQKSGLGAVNIRSFDPRAVGSREFLYGLYSLDSATAHLERLTAEGLHTIVNETGELHDGGVSGVLMADVLEFAPDDTPRCVDGPGTASLGRDWGQQLLATVYRLPIDFPVPFASRLEFSVHTRPWGWRQENVIVWELQNECDRGMKPHLAWPNNFSRLVGDKVFGLLIAHHLGLPVPAMTVVNRRLAPFSFGLPTNWHETWVRTAPTEPTPGKYSTHRGWKDPFELLGREDPDGEGVASIVAQEGVRPHYSGALIVDGYGTPIIEGRGGPGDGFMLGTTSNEHLPEQVVEDIRELYAKAASVLGPVKLEWVHDGQMAWVVQLHRGASRSRGTEIVPGEAELWVEFDVTEGLERLRALLADLEPATGLLLRGQVGLTGHIADVIRKADVPARLAQ